MTAVARRVVQMAVCPPYDARACVERHGLRDLKW